MAIVAIVRVESAKSAPANKSGRNSKTRTPTTKTTRVRIIKVHTRFWTLQDPPHRNTPPDPESNLVRPSISRIGLLPYLAGKGSKRLRETTPGYAPAPIILSLCRESRQEALKIRTYLPLEHCEFSRCYPCLDPEPY